MSRTLKIELPCRRELNFHVFPVSAFSRDFWLNLERLGRLLGSTWSFLGASWPQLGRSWDQLGANSGAPGTNLAPTWALGGPSWDELEPTLDYHGRSCNALVALLVTLGRLWTLQGRSRLDFGAPKKDSGASERRFRQLQASVWNLWCVTSAAMAHRKRIRQQRRSRIVESEITTTMQQQRK